MAKTRKLLEAFYSRNGVEYPATVFNVSAPVSRDPSQYAVEYQPSEHSIRLTAEERDIAARSGIDLALMHRVAVIGSGTLDILPHNGAVVSLLAICGLTHRDSYLDIVMVGIVSSLLALVIVIALGSVVGSF